MFMQRVQRLTDNGNPFLTARRDRHLRCIVSCAAALLSGVVTGVEPPDAQPSLTNLADELSIDQLGSIPVATVTTASRFTQKVSDAPASVTVVTAEQIRGLGYRTLAEILQGVPGLYTTSDRTYTYLGIRGFSKPGDFNSRVLIMVDGHRINDDLFGSSYIAHEFLIDPDLIERVEVVRGPTSSLYGNSALLGVINIITRKPTEYKGIEVSAEVGDHDTYKYSFWGAGPLPGPGASLLISGSFYQSAGNPFLYYPEFDTGMTQPGIAENLDGEQAFNLFGNLTVMELTLTTAYVARQKHIPTASWSTHFNDPSYDAWDKHGYVDLKLQHEFSDRENIMVRAYYDNISYMATYPLISPLSPAERVMNEDWAVGQMVGAEAQVVTHWKANTVTAGGEVRQHLEQDIENYDVDPLYFYADVDHTSADGGLYLQDELAIITNLTLNGGVRLDLNETYGSAVSPRLGMVSHPWEEGTAKLLYGRAFRAPNTYELYFPLTDTPPSADLDPEYIETYEAVIEQSLPGNVRLSVAGFTYYIDDLIALNPDTLAFENIAHVRTRGAEFECDWHHSSGLRVLSSYTLSRAEDLSGNDRLSNSPEHLAKLAVMSPRLTRHLRVGVEGQYTSRTQTLPERETRYANSFSWANLTLLGESLKPGLDLSVSLYNLFNAHYDAVGSPGTVQDIVQQDGRSLRLKLTYRF